MLTFATGARFLSPHVLVGQPMQFVRNNRVHRLAHVAGPERIGGQWWDGHDKTRDYFDVEDTTGRRWWVFRVLETFKWYLHGSYE